MSIIDLGLILAFSLALIACAVALYALQGKSHAPRAPAKKAERETPPALSIRRL